MPEFPKIPGEPVAQLRKIGAAIAKEMQGWERRSLTDVGREVGETKQMANYMINVALGRVAVRMWQAVANTKTDNAALAERIQSWYAAGNVEAIARFNRGHNNGATFAKFKI